MTNERRQILDMLAEGKISAADAERLLDKISSLGQGDEPETDGGNSGERLGGGIGERGGERVKGPRPKYFRVLVNDTDGSTVNIRVPLAFVRAGIKLSTVMPMEARKKIEERGIDLSHMSDLKGEDLIDALRELTIDVNDADGDQVRIFCE